jgi:3-hydroxyacyl-CoA dehydrogenase
MYQSHSKNTQILDPPQAHPDRLVVAHPFNPVYLLPLVEVCGGKQTTERTKEIAAGFFKFLGMHPLIVRVEVGRIIKFLGNDGPADCEGGGREHDMID